MKRFSFALAAVAALAFAAPAAAIEVKVPDPTPNALFTDSQGNQGYGELDTDEQALRACNENPDATPAGDQLSGYAYISAGGETSEAGPTYGNENVGATDTDGEGVDNAGPDGIEGTDDDEVNSSDCP